MAEKPNLRIVKNCLEEYGGFLFEFKGKTHDITRVVSAGGGWWTTSMRDCHDRAIQIRGPVATAMTTAAERWMSPDAVAKREATIARLMGRD